MKIKKIVRRQTTYEDVLSRIDPKTMDFNDIRVLKRVFWEGNTCGIFSVTSAGMQKLFMRVKPTCFDDVAAVCALYRPGPLGAGMDGLYADRKNGIEKVTYDHPILEDILKDTWGCFVYQENVLETCRRLCSMSWKDTNRVRKHFLKKDKSKADEFLKKEDAELKDKVVGGAVANGMSQDAAEQLWTDFGKWGSYGFNRAHSYAYAMVTMQTAYLRYHHPLEFFSALLTVGQADELQSYVNDIRKQGFKILPVDVNMSRSAHVLEGDAIRLSLLSVKGVGASAVTKILANQPYTSVQDFLLRSGSTKTATIPLVRVGALSGLEPQISTATILRRAELWYSDAKVRHVKNREALDSVLGALDAGPDDPVEIMQAERELLGFNLRGTPFSIKDRERKVDALRTAGLLTHATIKELLDDEDSQRAVIPLVVRSLKEKPQKNGRMFAFVSLADRDGQATESVAFNNVWEHVRATVRPGDVYLTTVHRKEGEPGSLVIGLPGWKISPSQAAAMMLPIDSIEI